MVTGGAEKCGSGSQLATRHDGDLVVTVCDLAHEEFLEAAAVHWSIPDPVPAGGPGSFDAALAQLADRVGRLAPRLTVLS